MNNLLTCLFLLCTFTSTKAYALSYEYNDPIMQAIQEYPMFARRHRALARDNTNWRKWRRARAEQREEIQRWYQKCQIKLLKQKFVIPGKTALGKSGWKCILKFKESGKGAIEKFVLVESTGNRKIDQAVKKTICQRGVFKNPPNNLALKLLCVIRYEPPKLLIVSSSFKYFSDGDFNWSLYNSLKNRKSPLGLDPSYLERIPIRQSKN